MNTRKNNNAEPKKTVYYCDELNDDFAGTNINTKQTPKDFAYVNKNVFLRAFSFVLYYFIAFPLVWTINKVVYFARYKNRKVLKQAKNQGYFLYGNHTILLGDAFSPSIISAPKRAYIIANPDATSIKGVRTIVKALGVLPTPYHKETYAKFFDAIETRLKQKATITIYPEAHIWPYCTKIRNFNSVSFKFPVKFNAPSFCFTTTYKKRKLFKKPRAVIYIDGPFYPNQELSKKEQELDLRDRIYQTMCTRSKESNYDYIKYVKKEESTTNNTETQDNK